MRYECAVAVSGSSALELHPVASQQLLVNRSEKIATIVNLHRIESSITVDESLPRANESLEALAFGKVLAT